MNMLIDYKNRYRFPCLFFFIYFTVFVMSKNGILSDARFDFDM